MSVNPELCGCIRVEHVCIDALDDVNQSLPSFWLCLRVLGFVQFQVEIYISRAAGRRKSGRWSLSKCGYCEKQCDKNGFHDFPPYKRFTCFDRQHRVGNSSITL